MGSGPGCSMTSSGSWIRPRTTAPGCWPKAGAPL
jgi:hypothetical protein